jgi:hypothetical protein
MRHGFVTRNCARCSKKDNLPEAVFRQLGLWVACPECKERMAADILPDKNYGFVCESCGIAIQLFALLPRWEDL